jgi:hypothetical protein
VVRRNRRKGRNVPLRVVFLESICDDLAILQANYGLKLFNDDYKCTGDAEAAKEDFQARVRAYEQQYEPLSEAEITAAASHSAVSSLPVGSLRVINGGKRLELSHLGDSHLCADICPLLQSMHLLPRDIVLVLEDCVDKHLLVQLALRKPRTSLLFGVSREALQLARQVEGLLQLGGGGEELNTHPVISLRNLATRRSTPSYSLPAESFTDLARRMRDVILLVERLPECVLVVCPDEEVRHVFLSHFIGCPDGCPHVGLLPAEQQHHAGGPAIELRRDHGGFIAHEIAL